MPSIHSVRSLSPARAGLVDLLHDVAFGKLEHLIVRDGEPCLDPPLTIKELVLFGRDATNRSSRSAADLPAEIQIQQLFAQFDRRGSFEIDELKIVDALPALMWAMRGLRA